MIATGKAQWAKVLPNQLVTNDQFKDYNYWSIDLEVDAKEKKRLMKEGLRPYFKGGKEETNIFKFQRKETTRAGKENGAPTVVDANKNPWNNGEIGNGSKVKLSFFPFDHAMTDSAGIGKILNAIQVIDHVAYEGASGVSEFEAEGVETEEF